MTKRPRRTVAAAAGCISSRRPILLLITALLATSPKNCGVPFVDATSDRRRVGGTWGGDQSCRFGPLARPAAAIAAASVSTHEEEVAGRHFTAAEKGEISESAHRSSPSSPPLSLRRRQRGRKWQQLSSSIPDGVPFGASALSVASSLTTSMKRSAGDCIDGGGSPKKKRATAAGGRDSIGVAFRLRLRGGDNDVPAEGTADEGAAKTSPSVAPYSKVSNSTEAESVTALQRGPTSESIACSEWQDLDLTFTDKFVGRAFSLLLGWAVAAQAVGSLIDHEDIFDSVSRRFLSEETAGAVRTIRQILNRFADHGVVDVLSVHSPQTVVSSMLALSRLQEAAAYCEGEGGERPGRLVGGSNDDDGSSTSTGMIAREDDNDGGGISNVDPGLLRDLARYAPYANAAYGWKGALALFGRFHRSDVRALMAKTGVDASDVVSANWHARTHRPAYFLVRDTELKKLVLSIRGTFSARDVLTDLCCAAEDFQTRDDADIDGSSFSDREQVDGGRGGFEVSSLASLAGEFADALRTGQLGGARARAHQGMLDGARGVARMTRSVIASEFAARPDYDLIIVGHSLGGGTAAVLGSMWRETFPGLTVYAYGPPCVGPAGTSPTTDSERVVSVVGEGDPFSCLSLGHLADLSAAISELCGDEVLRGEVLRRTKGGLRNMTKEDLWWCRNAMEGLRGHMTGEKFYPPGRILHLRGAVNGNGNSNSNGVGGNGGTEISIHEVPTDKFRDLKLHPRMLDLTQHIPGRYESALNELWMEASKGESSLMRA